MAFARLRSWLTVALLLAAAASGVAAAAPPATAPYCPTPPQAMQHTSDATAAGQRGAALLQRRHYVQAEPLLQSAYCSAPIGAERSLWAMQLGSLAALSQQPDTAAHYYTEALGMVADAPLPLWLSARLALARLAPAKDKLAHLEPIAQRLEQALPNPALARYHLDLGQQARQIGHASLALAYHHLERARSLAMAAQDGRLHVQTLDALAQLYEDHARRPEALQLTQEGLLLAHRLALQDRADLLVALEWRQGRLQQAQGQPGAALAAYARAVEQLEATRQDLPLETSDGQSSFRVLIEPLYLGYVDLLLHTTHEQPSPHREAALHTAIEAMEQLHQAQLQDFLGDRCAWEVRSGKPLLPAGTGVLYPVILADRLELLLQTPTGVVRRTSPVAGPLLRSHVRTWADTLRLGDEPYLPAAQQLYDWLLRPVEAVLSEQGIDHLVVVPDSTLRLIPVAALHNGQHYAIEQWAISVVTSMGLTSLAPPQTQARALVTGVALPGPAVEKMAQSWRAPPAPPTVVHRGLAQHTTTRTWQQVRTAQAPTLAQWQDSLALPGVRDEIQALHQLLPGTALLDAGFTVGQFQRETASGQYRIVHIASHGVFGDSAATSFIMAYDDLLRLPQFQTLLESEALQRQPIELLTLSACQTAQGNERAPLGLSGVAIKAHAQSVLGTLWPIADLAAKAVMEQFYTGLAQGRLSKAQALRQAQLQLLYSHDMAHPFFWAPFILIGNWL